MANLHIILITHPSKTFWLKHHYVDMMAIIHYKNTTYQCSKEVGTLCSKRIGMQHNIYRNFEQCVVPLNCSQTTLNIVNATSLNLSKIMYTKTLLCSYQTMQSYLRTRSYLDGEFHLMCVVIHVANLVFWLLCVGPLTSKVRLLSL